MKNTNDSHHQDPYRIDQPQEIDQILMQLLERGILLRMHNGNANHAVITTLLNIDFENEIVVIDSAAQQTMNRQLLSDKTAYFETQLDQVAIRFCIHPIDETIFNGHAALSGPLPLSLRRIQRRESYRIQPSALQPATCALNNNKSAQQLHVYDISAGGISLLDEAETSYGVKGDLFNNNSLNLPGIGEIEVDLALVRQQYHLLPSGRKIQRLAFSFFQLPGSEQIRIQNYINQEERLKRARDRGFI